MVTDATKQHSKYPGWLSDRKSSGGVILTVEYEAAEAKQKVGTVAWRSHLVILGPAVQAFSVPVKGRCLPCAPELSTSCFLTWTDQGSLGAGPTLSVRVLQDSTGEPLPVPAPSSPQPWRFCPPVRPHMQKLSVLFPSSCLAFGSLIFISFLLLSLGFSAFANLQVQTALYHGSFI